MSSDEITGTDIFMFGRILHFFLGSIWGAKGKVVRSVDGIPGISCKDSLHFAKSFKWRH